MGIFDFWFKKHGHKKDKEIQELLAVIKRQERNESWLIKENERLYNDLQKCLHPHRPHRVKLVYHYS